jgi:uncharacterized protein
MRILLPPSEGKTAPQAGEALSLERLSLPELTETRRRVLEALLALCREQPEQARLVLGLTEGQQEAVVRNQTLPQAPTAPAWQVYTGVLYSQLAPGSLTPEERARLGEWVWISSALFGFVGFTDPICAYRLSGDTTLPTLGSLARLWGPVLTPLLEQEPGLVVDLRSGVYVTLAPLPKSVQARAVTVRVLQKQVSGPPKLITHFNKATKGQLVRELAKQARAPESVEQLVACWLSVADEVRLVPGVPTLVEVLLAAGVQSNNS